MLKYAIEQRKLYLNLYSEVNSMYAFADERRIKQIIINLLSNAVKFTQQGGITIKIKKKDEMIKITVRDTGIGVKEEDYTKMFTEFCTISSHQKLNPNGTGLGLYLSKKFAHLMNGNITMKSVYGVGTKFTVTVPLSHELILEDEKIQEDVHTERIPLGITAIYNKERLMESREELKLHTTYTDSTKNQDTVLVVDDQPMNSQVIAKMLNRYSLNCETALNGKEAIKMVKGRKTPYSLILMDVNMPVMGGSEVFDMINIGSY